MRAVSGRLTVPHWRQPATIVGGLAVVSFVLSIFV
jgi:hypothetical protein